MPDSSCPYEVGCHRPYNDSVVVVGDIPSMYNLIFSEFDCFVVPYQKIVGC